MTKSRNIGLGKEPTPSAWDKMDGTQRGHIEAALAAVDDGSPRMFVRFHLYEIRRILNESKHMPRPDGTRIAMVSDSVTPYD